MDLRRSTPEGVTGCAAFLREAIERSAEPAVRRAYSRKLVRLRSAALPTLAGRADSRLVLYLSETGTSSTLIPTPASPDVGWGYRAAAEAAARGLDFGHPQQPQFHRMTPSESRMKEWAASVTMLGAIEAPPRLDPLVLDAARDRMNFLVLDFVISPQGGPTLVRQWCIGQAHEGADAVSLSTMDAQLMRHWRAMDVTDPRGSAARMRRLGDLLIPSELSTAQTRPRGHLRIRADLATSAVPFRGS